jgi:4-oxalocrotonate tautomerase
MPIVRIELWEGRTEEQKEKLIGKVSECVADTLGVDIEHVEVLVFDVPKANWGIGGRPASKM